MHDDRRRLAGTVAVLAAAACFGTLGPVSRLSYEAGLEPIAFITWRAVIGALVLLAIIALRHVRRGGLLLLRGVPPRQWVALLVATAAGFVLNLSLFVAFDRIPVALALLGFYTYPVMVAVAGVILHGDPLGGTRLAALVLAMGGMVLVVAGQLDPAAGVSLDAFGFLLALVAAASQTVFVLIGRRGYRSVPTEHASMVVIGGGALAYLVLVVGTGSVAALAVPLESGDVLALVVFAGVVAAGLASFLFITGIRLVGPVRTGILSLFEPVVGVVLAAVVLGETLRPVQLVGGALVLAAVALLQRTPDRLQPEAHPAPLVG
jgi:drug/metabolite transporter (DMT)-like permease